MEECPCGGEREVRWHYLRDMPPCDSASKKRRARDQKLRDKKRAAKPVVVREKKPRVHKYRPKVRWTPGTDIVLPEFDPL